jgi:integration host factor subunit beta
VGRTTTKRELCERIAKKTGFQQIIAKEVVQIFLDEIINELAAGNRLEFRRFGSFYTRVQSSHQARNPHNSEVVHVPERINISFRPGKAMLEKAQEVLRLRDPQEPGEKS